MIEAFVHGTLHPDNADAENIKLIHLEHAAEAHAMIGELDALETARQLGVDPITGKPPRTEKKWNELAELFANEPGRIRRRFDEHLAAYADAFGLVAADAFAISIQLRHRGIEVVQRTKPEPMAVSLIVLNNPRLHAEDQWDEGHPWHYLYEGDRATPVPVDQIEPSDKVHQFDIKLPKDEHRKRERLESMHREAVKQLERDRQRYEDLRLSGTDAISEYDRTIAYGGNLQLAWASSTAMKFCHVRHSLARVAELNRLLGKDAVLFDTADAAPASPTSPGA
ncbi:MAG: hypothetical protein AAF663_08665 [Planctomycetota bacterium]